MFDRVRTYDPCGFHGRVIDGPYEGDVVRCDRPYFEVVITPPVSIVDHSKLAAIETLVNHHVYTWSRSLSAWVFRWGC